MRAPSWTISPPPPPAPRVIIVDDAEDNREMYAVYLKQAGFRVDEAATASQALDQIEQEPTDLVVTDIALPGIDGYELCRRVKREGHEHTRVIALTGLSLAESDIERAIEAGSDAVLFKPCLPDRLLREIRKVLARSTELRFESRVARNRAIALSRRSSELQQRTYALQDRYRRIRLAIRQKRLIERIRRAYDERPMLAITAEQAAFLWSADVGACRCALDALVQTGVLIYTDADIYVRATSR